MCSCSVVTVYSSCVLGGSEVLCILAMYQGYINCILAVYWGCSDCILATGGIVTMYSCCVLGYSDCVF